MANTARIATLATPWGDTFGKDLTPTGNELGGPYNYFLLARLQRQ